MKRVKFWITLFLVASTAITAFYWYVWMYKPPEYKLPKFSIVQILLIFAITFFPSIISRLYANIKTGQVDLDFEGLVDTIRDCVHGWYSYYILAFIAFILWDYFIFGEFPQFW